MSAKGQETPTEQSCCEIAGVPISGQVSNRTHAQKATFATSEDKGTDFQKFSVTSGLSVVLPFPRTEPWGGEPEQGLEVWGCSSEEWGPSCRKACLLQMVKLWPLEWVIPQSLLLLMLLKRHSTVQRISLDLFFLARACCQKWPASKN